MILWHAFAFQMPSEHLFVTVDSGVMYELETKIWKLNFYQK